MINIKNLIVCLALGLVVSSATLYAQKQDSIMTDTSVCECCAFLNPFFTRIEKLFDQPGGNVIKELLPPPDLSDLSCGTYFYLHSSNDSMFYVTAYEITDTEGDSVTGWIRKGPQIGIYSRYELCPLKFYTAPDKDSPVQYIIKSYSIIDHLIIVIDCKGKWLKVRTSFNGKVYEGWVAPEDQCCEIITGCNGM